MIKDDEKEPNWALAPHIREVALQAAAILPTLGMQGVSALAALAEVTNSQASRWVNGLQKVPIRRALMVELNSGHRIRAEELLPEDEAFLLIAVRLAARPSPEQIQLWQKLERPASEGATTAIWRDLVSKAVRLEQGEEEQTPQDDD